MRELFILFGKLFIVFGVQDILEFICYQNEYNKIGNYISIFGYICCIFFIMNYIYIKILESSLLFQL